MTLTNDHDIVRGLGFVALHAAYLEEQIDNLLFMLQPVEPYPEEEQRWSTSQKIKKAKRLVAPMDFQYQDNLLADLDVSKQLLEWRNEVIHGRIYANFDRPDTLKSGRPNVPERVVDASELYDLANQLVEARVAVYRPMIFQIPNAIRGIQ
jgi:hypothetical protein